VAKFYAMLVRLGKIEIEDVPEKYRDDVETLLGGV
jgi:hypothetical protein